MDVIGLDASLVRGSHGSITSDSEGPLFITQQSHLLDDTAALERYLRTDSEASESTDLV